VCDEERVCGTCARKMHRFTDPAERKKRQRENVRKVKEWVERNKKGRMQEKQKR
jgi:hypothetical protein